MAIAFDAVTQSSAASSGVTFNSGATSSASTGVVAVLWVQGNGGPYTATWGGVSMTDLSASNYSSAQVFFLANPGSGAKSVVVSGGGSSVCAVALTYTGASPNVQFTGYSGDGGTSGGNVTANYTTDVDNALGIIAVFSSTTYSGGTGTTKRISSGSFMHVGDAGSPQGTAGAKQLEMTRDGGGTGVRGWETVALRPYVAPPEAPLYTINVQGFSTALQHSRLNMTIELESSSIPSWNTPQRSTTTWTNSPRT